MLDVDMAPAPARLAGSFVAPLSPDDDLALLLGQENAPLDEAKVPEAAWVAFERAGLAEAWRASCDGILGAGEEAWFAPPALAAVLEAARARRASLDDAATAVLDDVVALLERAQARGVAVVFAG